MEELRELWSTIKVFLLPILIVISLLFYNENKTEKKRKFDKKKNKDSSDELEENFNDYFGINEDKKYEDEWNYDNENQFDSIKILVKEQIYENIQMLDIEAKGPLNFTKDQIKLAEKEEEEAKFSCYVFDITDKDNEIPIQGLTDPYKDENYLLSSSRSMKVGLGFSYIDWTPMFRFPKSLVIPPNRGERKLKFVIYATKLKAKFEQGKIKNKKDLYFETITNFDLNYEDPGYLDSEKYEGDLNEKIVQLGMAVAYSEKKN